MAIACGAGTITITDLSDDGRSMDQVGDDETATACCALHRETMIYLFFLVVRQLAHRQEYYSK